jgi:uncharacterized protein YjbI with pentapeptide repeats
LIIPALILSGVVEYNLREASVKADRGRIDHGGAYEKGQAAQGLVAGCAAQGSLQWLPSYLTERLLGNCRSLFLAPLASANLSNADLSGSHLDVAFLFDADLNKAHLSYADLRGANFSGAIVLATALRDIKALTQQQLEGKEPPLLCNAALPKGFTVNPNRDCDLIPQFLHDRYPDLFKTIEDAKAFVKVYPRQPFLQPKK